MKLKLLFAFITLSTHMGALNAFGNCAKDEILTLRVYGAYWGTTTNGFGSNTYPFLVRDSQIECISTKNFDENKKPMITVLPRVFIVFRQKGNMDCLGSVGKLTKGNVNNGVLSGNAGATKYIGYLLNSDELKAKQERHEFEVESNKDGRKKVNFLQLPICQN